MLIFEKTAQNLLNTLSTINFRENTMPDILVIDDDSTIREIVKDHLEIEEYSVETAIDGLQAVKILSSPKFECRLVITDIVMPEKEGLETIRDLKKNHKDVKILAMTGKNFADGYNYLFAAQTLGANDILNKPFDRDTLIEKVRKLIG